MTKYCMRCPCGKAISVLCEMRPETEIAHFPPSQYTISNGDAWLHYARITIYAFRGLHSIARISESESASHVIL